MYIIKMVTINNIAILKFNRGVTNPLNLDFLEMILEKISEIKKNDNIKGLVITSNNDKFFSMGFDLPELYQLETKEVEKFYRTFNQLCLELYSFPKPTVAAITGHAIAGGCILTLCCDYRFISEGKKLMGLNEIKLGIPMPYIAQCMLEHIVSPKHAREIIDTGEFLGPENLLDMGLVDKIFPVDKVQDGAVECLNTLGNYPNRAFEINLLKRKVDIRSKIESKLDEDLRYFIECWQRPEVRKLVAEAIKKF